MTSSPFELLAGNLQACPDAGVAIAASRWGATGLLNLEDVPLDRARTALDRLLAFGRGTLGVKLDASAGARSLAASLPDAVRLVILSTSASAEWPALVETVRRDARRVLRECTSEEQARLAIAAWRKELRAETLAGNLQACPTATCAGLPVDVQPKRWCVRGIR